jgi:hypothetical protein
MDWFGRLQHWQRICISLSVVGLLAAIVVVFVNFPADKPKLARQLAAPECQPVRSLPSNQISPHALAKELYALYMQCDELFWQRARHPQSALTLEEYESELKDERQSLLLRVLAYWLTGVAVLFVTAFLIVRALTWLKPGSDTHAKTG